MKISVYLTSYNKERYLPHAIESVLNQSLQPFEILIIDDCSTDNSIKIIKGYKSRYPDKIKLIINKKNLGITKTRNLALKHCKGSVVTFLDGDDLFYKNKLLNEANILKSQNNTSAVYSNFNYIDKQGKILGSFSDDNHKPVIGNIFKETFLKDYNATSGNNYIYEMFYKNCALDIGAYDEKIRLWEDWDFRIRMSKKYEYGYCININSAYRKLKSGLHNSNKESHYRELIKVYKKNKNLLNDLTTEEKNIVKNKVYARLKTLILPICENNLNNRNYMQFLKDIIDFLLTFRMRKAIKYLMQLF